MKRAVNYHPVWPAMTIWGLFTVVAFWFGASSAYENHLFSSHAEHVQGTVLKKYETDWQGKNGTVGYTHYIVYGYVAGTLLGNCQTLVHGDIWSQLSEGGPIPVKYLPGDPQNSRIDDATEDAYASIPAWVGLGLGLVILLAGAPHFAWMISRNKLYFRLLATGTTGLGTVTAIKVETGGRDTVRPYLELEFADEQGRVVQGRTWAMTEQQQWFWEIGKAIQIFYDPVHPDVFTVELNPTFAQNLGEAPPPVDPFQSLQE